MFLKISGVYCIKNKINNKVYVGSSIDIHGRFMNHKSMLGRNRHDSIHLQRAWNMDGWENFEFIILEKNLTDAKQLCAREQYWVNFYKSNSPEFGYNIRRVVESNLGWHHSAETRGKMSMSRIGSPGYWTGKKRPKDTCDKISVSKRGAVVSSETKEKQSKSHAGLLAGRKNPMFGKFGKDNPCYGKHRTEAQRIKMGESHKGQVAWNKGIPQNESHRRRMIGNTYALGKHWKQTNRLGEKQNFVTCEVLGT